MFAEIAKAVTDFELLLDKRPAVRSATALDDVKATTGTTVKRPNGQDYKVRNLTIDGRRVKDVDFLRLAREHAMPVLLMGVPGTGKTAMVEAALDDLITVQGTVETEVADFLGTWIQNPDGTFSWADGPLIVAAELGSPLLVDEIALIDPRVMAVVYSVMDGRDVITVTANPARGEVKVAPGFVVFGACNPDVPGAVMSDALLSRFKVHAQVESDWSVASSLGVPAKIVQVARNLDTKKKSGQLTGSPQLREVLTFHQIAQVFGERFALDNFISQAREDDRVYYTEAVQSVYDIEPTTLTF